MNFVTFIRNEEKMTPIRHKNGRFVTNLDYEFLADNDHSKSHKWRDLP